MQRIIFYKKVSSVPYGAVVLSKYLLTLEGDNNVLKSFERGEIEELWVSELLCTGWFVELDEGKCLVSFKDSGWSDPQITQANARLRIKSMRAEARSMHTPGMARKSIFVSGDVVHHAVLVGDKAIALTGVFEAPDNAESHENALRIALGWNLLSAFTTEDLTHGIDLVKLVRQIGDLKDEIGQNAALLAEKVQHAAERNRVIVELQERVRSLEQALAEALSLDKDVLRTLDPLPNDIKREYDRIHRRDMALQNKQDIVSPGGN